MNANTLRESIENANFFIFTFHGSPMGSLNSFMPKWQAVKIEGIDN